MSISSLFLSCYMILNFFDVAHSTRMSHLSFRWPRTKQLVALSDVFVCPSFRIGVIHHSCVIKTTYRTQIVMMMMIMAIILLMIILIPITIVNHM